MNLKQLSERLKTDIPAIYLALKKEETPFPAKMAAAITIGYTLSPIDLIPDFIPILGYLDDLLLLPCLIALTVKLIPADVLTVCREESKALWLDGRPERWFCALPVLFLWGILILAVLRAIQL